MGRDDDDDDYRPRRKKGPSEVWWAMLIGSGLALALTLALLVALVARKVERGDIALPPPPTKNDDDRVVRMMEDVRFGPLQVTVYKAGILRWYAKTFTGQLLVPPPKDFVVYLALNCRDPNKIAEARSQAGSATLRDDVGNSYPYISPTGEFRERAIPTKQIPPGETLRIRSDKGEWDQLIFDRPVPGAKSVTLSLDASVYGGKGRILCVIPREDWSTGD